MLMDGESHHPKPDCGVRRILTNTDLIEEVARVVEIPRREAGVIVERIPRQHGARD
jgi:hypothetical protein